MRFGRPVLDPKNGCQFMLNDGNTKVLIKAWGAKSEDWAGKGSCSSGTWRDCVDPRRQGDRQSACRDGGSAERQRACEQGAAEQVAASPMDDGFHFKRIRRGDLGPNNKRVAQLLRMLGSTRRTRNAWTALERAAQSEGIGWFDIGNARGRPASATTANSPRPNAEFGSRAR
jgi:hypothetical protein